MSNSSRPYSRIRVRKPVITITGHDIDELLEQLRRQQATWSSVRRPAVAGDQLVLTCTGWIGDEQVFSSGSSPATMVLGSGQHPGEVHKALTGSRAGDRVRVSVMHRDTDPDPALAGKRVSYDYHVHDVCKLQLPPLNKAFAHSLGVTSGSLRRLRKQVKDTLQQQTRNFTRRKERQQLLEGLLAIHGNADLQASKSPAERQHVLAQIMQEIIRKNRITVDLDKVNAAISAIAAASDDPDRVAGEYFNNHRLYSDVEASVLENQVLEFVLRQARVTETAVSIENIRDELAEDATAAAHTTAGERPDLPVIRLTRDNKCGFCARNCCTYITQRIDAPRSKADFSHLLWQVSHQQVEAYKDKRDWYLMFRTDCEHLLPDGRCGNYEQRMAICRKYSNKHCEFDAPADEGFDLHFRDYDSLLRYCRQRFKHWEY